jgi:hypothetical protein
MEPAALVKGTYQDISQHQVQGLEAMPEAAVKRAAMVSRRSPVLIRSAKKVMGSVQKRTNMGA